MGIWVLESQTCSQILKFCPYKCLASLTQYFKILVLTWVPLRGICTSRSLQEPWVSTCLGTTQFVLSGYLVSSCYASKFAKPELDASKVCITSKVSKI